MTNSKLQIISNYRPFVGLRVGPEQKRMGQNSNDLNSFGHLVIAIWNLFVIWCLEFVNFDKIKIDPREEICLKI